MIRINLTGESGQRFDPRYLVDLVVLACAFAIGHYGMNYYLSVAKESINIVKSETDGVAASLEKLKGETARFESLEGDIQQLTSKIDAIRSITVSVFERYKPLIVLEHLQVLQPDGLWYDSLKMTDDKVEIAGAAFNNILIAEFLTALDSTKTQELDPVDLRTQVFFDFAKLKDTQLGGKVIDNRKSTKFSIDVGFKTREYTKEEPLALNDVR